MGLTIHYKLTVAEDISSAEVRVLVERAAQHVKENGLAETGEIFQVEPDCPFTSWFVKTDEGDENESTFIDVPAQDGWLAPAFPGDGCESVFLALCRYPREVSSGGKAWPTGCADGWVFHGHCKTQFAAEHGREHFLRCHRAVIGILDFWRQLGVGVEVMDEGDYWESRSEEKLLAALQKYDGLLAAVAGVLKDKGRKVESPIFARKDFERLEAAGHDQFKDQLSQLADLKDKFNEPL